MLIGVPALTPLRANRWWARFQTALVVAVFAFVAPLAACGGEGVVTAQPAAGASHELPEVLATIGGQPITLADVRSRAGSQLAQIETQFLRSRSQVVETALQSILHERTLQAEARRQSTRVEDLITAEAGPGGLTPNDVEITAWYQQNRERLSGRPLDQLRSQIADHLQQERRREAVERLVQRLNKEYDVVVHFQPFRATLNNEGAPSLGTPNAAVTVAEFSDFQCPFCARFAPTLKRLVQEFGDQVYVVYRQFPLTSIHPNAFKAAEASLCAHEQGKFWELHDLMFAEPDRLTVSELKEKAGRLSIEQRRFDACLDSGRYVEQVQNDFREGQALGVTGTPAVFINGAFLPGGAVPYETVAAAVRKELERVQIAR